VASFPTRTLIPLSFSSFSIAVIQSPFSAHPSFLIHKSNLLKTREIRQQETVPGRTK
jgi:hypothetical protein